MITNTVVISACGKRVEEMQHQGRQQDAERIRGETALQLFEEMHQYGYEPDVIANPAGFSTYHPDAREGRAVLREEVTARTPT